MRKFIALIVIIALAAGGWYYYKNYYQHSAGGSGERQMFGGPGSGGARQGAGAGRRGGDGQTSGSRRGAGAGAGTANAAPDVPPGTPDENGEIAKSVRVKRDKIELTVNTTGKISANQSVEIKSKASGTIIKLPYDISDRVTSGMLLCELDPVDELRSVKLKEVSLLSARARAEQQRDNYTIQELTMQTKTVTTMSALEAARVRYNDSMVKLARAVALFEKQMISKEELETARNDTVQTSNTLRQAEMNVEDLKSLPHTLNMRKTDIQLAEASVLQAEVDLETARQRLTECTIYAPSDGVITQRAVQNGQIIASGVSNVGGGTVLMVISDTSHLYVDANVDEADIGKVKVGQNVIITADAFIGKQFDGKVVRVAAQGDNKSNVVTFAVRIEVGKSGLEMLRPEMTANIEIEADRRAAVLTLPNEAIQMFRGENFVEIPGRHGDGVTSVTVVTGLTDGLKTEIVSGVEEGQEVMYPSALVSKWSKPSGGNFGQSMQRAAMMNRGGRR